MSKIKALVKLMMVVGLVFGISFGLGVSIQNLLLADNKPSTDNTTIAKGERTNILLLGVDARPGEKQGRTDTMILASIDPKLNKVALVSIPRDTQIEVAGSSLDKINSANMVGGPDLAVQKVEELMGENIDYYVEMDFKGFAKIIDTVGGVNINVDQRMYKPSEDINLRPGQQLLDGSQALAFVRFRGYALADIERTAHQQTFLKALGRELLQPKNILKLPTLIKVANQNIDTNLRLADMLKMVAWVPGFSSDSIVAQTLPGYFLDKRDAYGNLTASYWVADKTKTEGLLEKMLAGQTVAVVSEAPASNSAGNSTATNAATSGSKSVATSDQTNWERSQLPSAGHGIKNKV
jgi:LCP family protein required for cell wall assembly